jgi:flavin-dependent dehydrogenase
VIVINKTIIECQREIPVYANVDVVVCGGGPAGLCAALSAARLGVSVLLIEHYGFLGGVITASGVNGIGGWQHDLDGRPLIGGIAREIMFELSKKGAADGKRVQEIFHDKSGKIDYKSGLGSYFININPEYFKIVADELTTNAGVKLLYHSSAVMPVMEQNKVVGIYIENKSGRMAVLAKIIIDCTGDGDIAARAGAEFEIGRTDGA